MEGKAMRPHLSGNPPLRLQFGFPRQLYAS